MNLSDPCIPLPMNEFITESGSEIFSNHVDLTDIYRGEGLVSKGVPIPHSGTTTGTILVDIDNEDNVVLDEDEAAFLYLL
ncbi:unnamed protein product [Trichobilharzia regenti]|nr:unnamed protein product [Trichobilharzia regenti]